MVKKSVTIIEPDKNYSLILQSLLANSADLYLIKSVYNHSNNLRQLQKDDPDIILVEIAFPTISPTDLIRLLRRIGASARIIVLSSITDKDTIVEALRAGADGYIVKTLDCHAILETLYQVHLGGVSLSRLASKAIVESFWINEKNLLTKRENEIMSLVSACKSYSEIGNNLSIGKETAKKHIRNIYKKLNVHRKSDAIHIARKEKFIIA